MLILIQLLTIGDQIVHDRRIGQCGGIAEITECFRGDVSQNTVHDLAGARFGQTVRPLNLVGRRDRTDDLADMRNKGLFEREALGTLLTY